MAAAVSWGEDPASVNELVALFVRSVVPAYISHGEIYCKRASDFSTWRDDLPQQLARELRSCMRKGAGERVVVAREESTIVGFAIVQLPEDIPYCTIDDIVIDKSWEGRGVGSTLLAWIETEAKRRGYRGILLESGLHNDAAHTFFLRKGFVPRAITMVKEF